MIPDYLRCAGHNYAREAAGLDQLGSIGCDSWHEGNGGFRDDARRFLKGDEVRRTQRGNNNTYCQDNELGWLDWNLLKSRTDFRRFVKILIAFRAHRDVVIEDSRFSHNQLSAVRLTHHGWHTITVFAMGPNS
jgi:pullulanase/glycogen debranching enzyme